MEHPVQVVLPFRFGEQFAMCALWNALQYLLGKAVAEKAEQVVGVSVGEKSDQPVLELQAGARVKFSKASKCCSQRPAFRSGQFGEALFEQTANRFWQPLIMAGKLHGQMPRVTAEDLVATLPAQQNLGILFARGLTNQIARDGRWVSNWVVQMPDDFRQQFDNFWIENDFAMVGLEHPRNLPRVTNVVRLALETLILFSETDGKGFDRLGFQSARDRQ